MNQFILVTQFLKTKSTNENNEHKAKNHPVRESKLYCNTFMCSFDIISLESYDQSKLKLFLEYKFGIKVLTIAETAGVAFILISSLLVIKQNTLCH